MNSQFNYPLNSQERKLTNSNRKSGRGVTLLIPKRKHDKFEQKKKQVRNVKDKKRSLKTDKQKADD